MRKAEEKHVLPSDIERTSMEIIGRELSERGIVLKTEEEPVIKRVIHASADFDYAQTLRFTPTAVSGGIAALQAGIPVITDTNMALAGISKASLKKLGCEAHCYMGDEDVAKAAREKGTTRAVAAMKKAAEAFPGAILAVGNAPTALLCIAGLIKEGLRPALVIGVPVGFVNVTESKEVLWETCLRFQIPAIVAMGRKGGSTIAAAVCNALLYEATDSLDPKARGWN